MSDLDPAKVEHAIRSIIADIDYDTHKSLESDEETGLNSYPDIAAEFITIYEKSN